MNTSNKLPDVKTVGKPGMNIPPEAEYYDRYNIDWLIQRVTSGEQLKYVCFWHEGEEYPNHVFSQWYEGKTFMINGRVYVTAEQYMMSEKALLFTDLNHYALIMNEPNPKACKNLGREVLGFEQEKWETVQREILFHGNLGKFQESSRLMSALLDTGDAILVEASPYDGIYGAGLRQEDLLYPDGSLRVLPQQWRHPATGKQATNHLGFVLMGIRDLLRDLLRT